MRFQVHRCNPKYCPLVLGCTGRSELPGNDCFDHVMPLHSSTAPLLARLPFGAQPNLAATPEAQSMAVVVLSALTLNFFCVCVCNFISNLTNLFTEQVKFSSLASVNSDSCTRVNEVILIYKKLQIL